MNGTITEADFHAMSESQRLWTIFHTLQQREIECGKRFVTVEKKQFIDKPLAAAMGFIGGFVAGLFKSGVS